MQNLKVEFFKGEDNKKIEQVHNIRKEVFIQEQNVDPELEMDNQDGISTHFLLLKEKEYIGTARCRQTKDGIKLERFAIVQKNRNKGYGKVLLDGILQHLKENKNKLYLHAQDKAVKFYQRNAFEIIGDAFVEADILHYLMRYKS